MRSFVTPLAARLVPSPAAAPVAAVALAGALAVSFVAGCSTADPDAAPAAAQAEPPASGARPAQAGKRAIAIDCTLGDAIDAPTREAVVRRAEDLVAALREGRHDALWQALHPQAQRPEDRQAFLDTLATLAGRLEGAPAVQPRVELVAHGTVKGGINDLARMVCRDAGSAEGPPALTVLVNAGGQDVAYVSLLIPGTVYQHAAVLQLRDQGGDPSTRWRLLGVQVHPSRFRGRAAVDWINIAGTLRRENKLVPAYVALAMAGAMASRGPSVTTPLSAAIDEDVAKLQAHPLFVAETKTWTVDGQDYTLHGLTLAATKSDVSLVVKYVNERGLVEDLVGRDADKLMDHVRSQYPELTDIVDAVVFEAYATAPGKGGPTVDAFRVAR
ncbi:MAG: hypothetical protein AAF721_42585, partial [Myxococcota bacterium]